VVADQGLYDSGDGRMTECEHDPDHLYHDHHEADLLREEIEKLKLDVSGLAHNNVSLVSLIHNLEQQLRIAKRTIADLEEQLKP
jgi:hypothetical protein